MNRSHLHVVARESIRSPADAGDRRHLVVLTVAIFAGLAISSYWVFSKADFENRGVKNDAQSPAYFFSKEAVTVVGTINDEAHFAQLAGSNDGTSAWSGIAASALYPIGTVLKVRPFGEGRAVAVIVQFSSDDELELPRVTLEAMGVSTAAESLLFEVHDLQVPNGSTHGWIVTPWSGRIRALF